MKASVFRKASFCAAHRLHNTHWSDEKNKAVFGVCNNPNYHGHNYELVVQLTGEIDPETGFVCDLFKLGCIINEEIEQRFDHKNLNLDIVEFRHLNTTLENILVVIWNILRARIEPQFDIKIRLYENPIHFGEYPVH
ncbi:MAG: hypothetical protein RL329_1031 [Bacteroidota bacterium]|jgi:6-pyruvoyltetrahydropterin/6-carboxytetrahydropterin synthase